ncbi:hypothetical protein [Chitinilyticum piscinae]|uniref:DUF3828 domain-containing protein n=1 Tax=Chitinilyticum piscinae TaxID=2866724 RepID=A0A8J7FHY7_9NEIS|nr:hypothetical protein [Chitinilyticum piscinae]MBE9608550.1 hypothetical protein [Chitinilyticum piscinae]
MKYWFLSTVLLLPLVAQAADPDEVRFKAELRKRNVVISERQMASIWNYVQTPEGANPLKGRELYQQLCDYKAYYDQKLMSYCHIALQESFRAQYPLAFLADYQPQAELRRYDLADGLAYVVDITGKVKDRAKHVPAVLRVRLEQQSGASRDFVLLWFDGYWAFVL